MMSGISITPALSAWIESPNLASEPTRSCRRGDDVNLGLADPDRLDQDVVFTRRIHRQGHLQGRLREPPRAPRVAIERMKHTGVEEVLREADPITEQGDRG